MDDSLAGLARLRETGLASPRQTQRALHFPESAASRLSVEAVLRGHNGCVNRMAWNQSGSLLASGSDDRRILLWSYPDTQRQPIALETEHQANIFGVRFLPQTGDARLVSGAMDHTVQLHQLDTPPSSAAQPVRSAGSSRRHPTTAVTPAAARTVVYSCHRSRVKDVAVEPANPHLFWSAAEDGCVRQFDTRVPTSQQRDYESPNMLLAVRSKGRYAELKSVNVNPAKPQQLVVGASDPFVRVYDRRMLTPGRPDRTRPPAAPSLCLAPPHLSLCAAGGTGGRSGRMHTTYVAFGNRGDKVVASYHGDHAYSFDITGAAPAAQAPQGTTAAAQQQQQQQQGGGAPPADLFANPTAAAALLAHRPGAGDSSVFAGSTGTGGMGDLPGMLPAAAERAKAEGNLHLFSKKYYEAVEQYSKAIRLAPWATILYTNRALALLQRGWEGDAVCALRDAETAVCLDPSNLKAAYRRAQALRAAGMLQSAATAARLFRQQFPDRASDVDGLEEQIAADSARQAQQAELRRQQAEQRRQLRRRRGMQFDREHHDRRQERQAGGAAGPAGRGAGTSQQGPAGAEPAAEEPAAEEPAGPHAAGGGDAAGGAEAAASAGTAAAAAASPLGSPAAAASESWQDMYASASSDEEEGDSSAAPTAAAGSSGLDAAYAAALEAAFAGGGGTPEGAAADPRAPSIDGMLAAEQQQEQQQGARDVLRRQPSLWNAFQGGRRMLQRFMGQCNMQTDIKEACFLGADDGLVAAGSDDGRVFIFSAATGECVRVLSADEDVANAVQCHPHLPVLATSGIEPTVKLWSPEGEPTAGGDLAEIIRRNQDRVKEGPSVLRGVDPRIIAALTDNPELLRALVQRATQRPGREAGGGEAGGSEEGEDEDSEDEGAREVSCRVA